MPAGRKFDALLEKKRAVKSVRFRTNLRPSLNGELAKKGPYDKGAVLFSELLLWVTDF